MKSEVHPNSVTKHVKEDTNRRNGSDMSSSQTNKQYADHSGDKAKLQELQKTNYKESSNESTNLENKEHKTDIAKGKNTSVKYVADGQSDPKRSLRLLSQRKHEKWCHKILPDGANRLIQVYCDMKKGGWTLIEKRQDSTTNFYRDCEDYREGFG
ncbi:angiopoietin-related protein 2-like, partial [Saccostrea cucullata]|uniref:angiopoietin-related protein 2-like n=1 Tax=Saccostrea cuccullata TaxID=36930 RepID=UPI002ED49E86